MPIDRPPTRAKTLAYKLRDWLKTDSPPMIVLGVVSIVTGIAYVVDHSTVPIHPIEHVTFMTFVGCIEFLWVIEGIMLLATCGFSRTKLAALSLSSGVILCFMWSGLLFTKFLSDHTLTTLASALKHATVGFLVMYIVWLKSTVEEQKTLLPTAKEIQDVLRDDAS